MKQNFKTTVILLTLALLGWQSADAVVLSQTAKDMETASLMPAQEDTLTDEYFFLRAAALSTDLKETAARRAELARPAFADSLPTWMAFTADDDPYHTYTSAETLSDRDFCALSLSVTFKVNKYNIASDDPIFDKIRKEYIPAAEKHNLHFHHLEIRGSASPEGPFNWNQQLGENRARTLVDSLRHYMDIPADYIGSTNVIEDYDHLYTLVEDNPKDPDREAILDILRNHHGDLRATKAALMSYKGGKTWKRLIKQYFPQLRTARVIIYYTVNTALDSMDFDIDSIVGMPWHPYKPVIPYFEFPSYEEEQDSTSNDSTHVTIPILSVKTNLLAEAYWFPNLGFCPTPNAQAELYLINRDDYTKSHTSLGLEYDFPWWSNDENHKYYQFLNWTLEYRWYFRKDNSFTGLYLGPYAHLGYYDIGLKTKKGWQGEGTGAGLLAGYVWRIGQSRHWKLDVYARGGFFYTKYDSYHPGDPFAGYYYYDWNGKKSAFKQRNNYFWRLNVNEIGISISYDLLFRSVDKPHKLALK